MRKRKPLTAVLDLLIGQCLNEDGTVNRDSLIECATKAYTHADEELPSGSDAVIDRYIEIANAWNASHAARAEDAADEDDPEEVVAPHMKETADARIREFFVVPELQKSLVCDQCSGKLPRDAYVVHVNKERNDKQEMKSVSYVACNRDHADELASGALVEKALQMTVDG